MTAQNGPQVHHPGNGVTLPVVVSEVKADYTPEAKAGGIQGTVGLDAVVLADDTVGDVTVAQSLDTVDGLDPCDERSPVHASGSQSGAPNEPNLLAQTFEARWPCPVESDTSAD
jgi:hypothetical protein